MDLDLDETTDVKEAKVVNILVSKIDGKPQKVMLVNQEIVVTADSIEIGKVFIKTLNELFGVTDYYDCVKLVVTDAAPYMKLCFKNMGAAMFKNMVHVTCIVHMLHLIAEEVRQHSGTLDKFIGQMKALLLKSKSRQNRFKQETGLKLPPKAIITRWCSWISVALYYLDNYSTVEQFLKKLISEKTDRSKPLHKLSKIVQPEGKNYSQFKQQLLYLETFRNLPEILNKLEDPKLTFKEQLDHLDTAEIEISSSDVATVKYKKLIEKNTGLQEIRDMQNDLVNIVKYKYISLTSVDVERSFSQYKSFLRPNRLSFTEDNIKLQSIISILSKLI